MIMHSVGHEGIGEGNIRDGQYYFKEYVATGIYIVYMYNYEFELV